MTPFADFGFFGLTLYAVIPAIVLGIFGRAHARWLAPLTLCLAVATIYLSEPVPIRIGLEFNQLWLVFGYAAWQTAISFAFLRWKSRVNYWVALTLSLLPLLAAKFIHLPLPDSVFGFIGI